MSYDPLQDARDVIAEETTTTARVSRFNSTGRGSSGERTGTWTLTSVTYPCRVMPVPIRANEVLTGGQLAGLKRYDIVLPHDADVNLRDRLEVEGVEYEIVSVPQGTDRLSLHVEATAAK